MNEGREVFVNGRMDEIMSDEIMSDEFKLIPTVDLIDPPLVLREVDQRSVEYVELRDSLAKLGFLNSICVRPSERQPGKFEVVDGRWRKTCSIEAKVVKIPCIIKYGLSDKDVLALQITANAVRYATHPSEFARQIRRLLHSKDGMLQAELCQLLNKSPTWVRKMLGMSCLIGNKVYRQAVDRGELSLEAAYYLSRLPRNFWQEYYTDALILPLREFKALVMSVLRQHRAQISVGSLTKQLHCIEPHPFMRTLTDLLSEIENNHVGALTIAAIKPTPLEAWFAALRWVIHLDSDSIERQRAKILGRLKRRAVKRL